MSRKPATTHYLSTAEFAERVGVKPDTLYRYKLPQPDALIGTTRGWLPATIDAWNEARPGRGARTDLAATPAPRGRNRAAEILETSLGLKVTEAAREGATCPQCGGHLTRDPMRPTNVVRCPAGHTFERRSAAGGGGNR